MVSANWRMNSYTHPHCESGARITRQNRGHSRHAYRQKPGHRGM